MFIEPAHIVSYRRVARSLLEKVDGYLWSRQPAALSPQLQSLEEKEREARRVAGGSTHEQVLNYLCSYAVFVVLDHVLQDLIQTDMEWKPTLEDSGRHWGMRVGGRKAECGICKLPLSVVMSEQQPGVLFFHCGEPVSTRICMCVLIAPHRPHLPPPLYSRAGLLYLFQEELYLPLFIKTWIHTLTILDGWCCV